LKHATFNLSEVTEGEPTEFSSKIRAQALLADYRPERQTALPEIARTASRSGNAVR